MYHISFHMTDSIISRVYDILHVDVVLFFTESQLLCIIPIYWLRPGNERRCYFVTTSLIGWAQA